jgi:hypothetical protein
MKDARFVVRKSARHGARVARLDMVFPEAFDVKMAETDDEERCESRRGILTDQAGPPLTAVD